MADDLVLVVDAGSSSIRCHLVDPVGEVRRSVSRPWLYMSEPDAGALNRGIDLEGSWQSLCGAIVQCLGSDGHRPSAIAVTSQRQSLVFTDNRGHAIYAGSNTDVRAVFQGSALDAEHGQMLYCTTGHRPTFLMAAGKLAWLREVRPSEYDRLTHVLTLADWLAYRLTGQLACEVTLAAASGLVDIRTRAWAAEMFDELGLRCPESQICESTVLRGTVIAEEVGLITGTPVIVAGADTQSALIGAGTVQAGQVAIVAGWSAPVQMLTAEPVLSPQMKTWTGLFQLPELWTMESSAGDIGNVWRWLAETVFGGERAFARMDRLAASIPPGSLAVTGHFGLQAMDVSAVGMRLGGILFPTPITLGGPTPGQIGRAALESFAYTIKANLEQLERESGIAASNITLGGGLSRSNTFRKILPEILGRPISMFRQPDTTAVGSAAIARTAIGEFSSLADSATLLPCRAQTKEPGPAEAAEYQDLYEHWLEVHESIGPLLR